MGMPKVALGEKDYLMTGYLKKRNSQASPVLRNWDKRWFALDEEQLYYAKSPKDASPRQSFKISSIKEVRVVEDPHLNRPSTEEFEVAMENRTLRVRALSESQRRFWLSALQKVTCSPATSDMDDSASEGRSSSSRDSNSMEGESEKVRRSADHIHTMLPKHEAQRLRRHTDLGASQLPPRSKSSPALHSREDPRGGPRDDLQLAELERRHRASVEIIDDGGDLPPVRSQSRKSRDPPAPPPREGSLREQHRAKDGGMKRGERPASLAVHSAEADDGDVFRISERAAKVATAKHASGLTFAPKAAKTPLMSQQDAIKFYTNGLFEDEAAAEAARPAPTTHNDCDVMADENWLEDNWDSSEEEDDDEEEE